MKNIMVNVFAEEKKNAVICIVLEKSCLRDLI